MDDKSPIDSVKRRSSVKTKLKQVSHLDDGTGENKFIVQSSTDSQQEKKGEEQNEPQLIIQRYDDIDE